MKKNKQVCYWKDVFLQGFQHFLHLFTFQKVPSGLLQRHLISVHLHLRNTTSSLQRGCAFGSRKKTGVFSSPGPPLSSRVRILLIKWNIYCQTNTTNTTKLYCKTLTFHQQIDNKHRDPWRAKFRTQQNHSRSVAVASMTSKWLSYIGIS